MKLTYRDIDPFLKSLNPAMRAVLVYGPDAGLVQERSMALSRQVVADLNDPFNTTHLTGDLIAGDPARLSDEASAQSLMGGKRLVRITAAGNDIAVPLKAWLKGAKGFEPNPDCVMIIEAGDLKPKDALRKTCEDAPNAAALPCYVEDERGLATLIRDTLRAAGYTIQADASTWLAGAIKGDRMRARMEIEKLILYMGPVTETGIAAANVQQRSVSLQDVKNSCGDAGTQSIDDLVYAYMDNKVQQTLHSYSRLAAEETPPMVLIRSLQNHVLRLHGVKTLVELHQQPLDLAMKGLQPPVFFKQADQFTAHVRKFSLGQLRDLLFRINDLEAKTKQSGMPADTLISQFLLKPAA